MRGQKCASRFLDLIGNFVANPLDFLCTPAGALCLSHFPDTGERLGQQSPALSLPRRELRGSVGRIHCAAVIARSYAKCGPIEGDFPELWVERSEEHTSE